MVGVEEGMEEDGVEDGVEDVLDVLGTMVLDWSVKVEEVNVRRLWKTTVTT